MKLKLVFLFKTFFILASIRISEMVNEYMINAWSRRPISHGFQLFNASQRIRSLITLLWYNVISLHNITTKPESHSKNWSYFPINPLRLKPNSGRNSNSKHFLVIVFLRTATRQLHGMWACSIKHKQYSHKSSVSSIWAQWRRINLFKNISLKKKKKWKCILVYTVILMSILVF